MHVIDQINEEKRTAVCSICGPTVIHSRGIQVRLSRSYRRWRCGFQQNKNRTAKRRQEDKRQDKCVRCGFLPENKCQLDIHHKDNNHFNDKEENLQTLCANCHRMVTFLAMPEIVKAKRANKFKELSAPRLCPPSHRVKPETGISPAFLRSD
jgi:5-methylcytosine-specific restriction endonuclease McrA